MSYKRIKDQFKKKQAGNRPHSVRGCFSKRQTLYANIRLSLRK